MGGLRPAARSMVMEGGNSNAWSAAWGAMAGAGSVLLVAAIVLLWRKPRKQELPMLAPMDVAQNVSSFLSFTKNCIPLIYFAASPEIVKVIFLTSEKFSDSLAYTRFIKCK